MLRSYRSISCAINHNDLIFMKIFFIAEWGLGSAVRYFDSSVSDCPALSLAEGGVRLSAISLGYHHCWSRFGNPAHVESREWLGAGH